MTMVVGYTPDEGGAAALHLAVLLARSAGAKVVVCTIAPTTWPAHPAAMDAEYRAYLDRRADWALTLAKARLPAEIDATFVVHHARSAAAGILEVADDHQAGMVVTGSSSGGVFGQVSLGSVTDRLLHSSPVPVALAPRGFRVGEGTTVTRVTAAYSGSSGDPDLILAVARVAARVGAALRIASFTVRPSLAYAGGIEPGSEDLVVNEWARLTSATLRAELDRVRSLPEVPDPLESVVGDGYTWQAALADVRWADGDVLAVGSGTSGPIARVFLGSRASKILRHSPVPVILVPRGVAEERVSRQEPETT